jgi:hypothetical protein
MYSAHFGKTIYPIITQFGKISSKKRKKNRKKHLKNAKIRQNLFDKTKYCPILFN